MASSTNSDAGVFPLLKLPAEIRNNIWELSIKDYHDDPCQPNVPEMIFFYHDVEPDEYPRQPPLLKVNAQIRAEALPVFYSETVFYLNHIEDLEAVPFVETWLKAIQPHVKHIRKMHFMAGIKCPGVIFSNEDIWCVDVTVTTAGSVIVERVLEDNVGLVWEKSVAVAEQMEKAMFAIIGGGSATSTTIPKKQSCDWLALIDACHQLLEQHHQRFHAEYGYC